MMKSVLIFTVLVSVLSATPSNAYDYFAGVDMSTLEINGETYEFPTKDGQNDRRSQVYFIKLALKGDETARETLLGGQDEMWFFIGKEKPIWLKIDKTSFEVIKP